MDTEPNTYKKCDLIKYKCRDCEGIHWAPKKYVGYCLILFRKPLFKVID